MAIAREDFIAWRSQTVTVQLLEDIAQMGADAASEMLTRTVANPERDMFVRGFVQGTAAVISWQPEFLTSLEGEIDDN